jgi:hypothetical protein
MENRLPRKSGVQRPTKKLYRNHGNQDDSLNHTIGIQDNYNLSSYLAKNMSHVHYETKSVKNVYRNNWYLF